MVATELRAGNRTAAKKTTNYKCVTIAT